MIIFNDTFSPLVAFTPGILAAIAALYQFYLIGFGCRPVPMPVWLFAAPLVLTGLSIYIFMQYDTPLPDSTNILLTAISLLVFGAATMIEAIVTTRHNRPAASRPTADSPVGLNDATH